MMNGPINIVIKDDKGGIANITIYNVMQSNGVIHHRRIVCDVGLRSAIVAGVKSDRNSYGASPSGRWWVFHRRLFKKTLAVSRE